MSLTQPGRLYTGADDSGSVAPPPPALRVLPPNEAQKTNIDQPLPTLLPSRAATATPWQGYRTTVSPVPNRPWACVR